MNKAIIVPFGEWDGHTMYAVTWAGEPKEFFKSVTEAQIYCISNSIPFEPWR